MLESLESHTLLLSPETLTDVIDIEPQGSFKPILYQWRRCDERNADLEV
jgi:hypothetical protein